MKRTYLYTTKAVLMFIAVCFFCNTKGTAQIFGDVEANRHPLYRIIVSVQEPNNLMTFTGTFNDTTDQCENGTATITPFGPIIYTVTPNVLSIGVKQRKIWTGTLTADPAKAFPGTTQPAKLLLKYDINFCRPEKPGVTQYGTVTSVYDCRGCPFHGAAGGTHEKVNYVGRDSLRAEVTSIKVQIAGKEIVTEGEEVTYWAVAYPNNVGRINGGGVKWYSSALTSIPPLPSGAIGFGKDLTVKILRSTTIKATYTFRGVSFSDSVIVVAKKR